MKLPETFNYVGCFLTMRCPYKCSYCINNFENSLARSYDEISGLDWIGFFNRLNTGNVPITLQGGEPGIHRDFIEIVKETSRFQQLDILTNLAFNLERFASEVDPELINRDAPYAPIRVSYHPEQFSLDEIIPKIQFLSEKGFRVGLYGVTHPKQMKEIEEAQSLCDGLGIDFRTKPFLGWYDGKMYGELAYPDACSLDDTKDCECAPSELLIAPDGSIHDCHHHLYNRLPARQTIFDDDLRLTDNYQPCSYYGHCNPCDVKVKNNRFQQFGHVSARIRLLRKAS